ncbi:uncharacterized protein LOC132599690 [Lycium barbarum]|uniref:uncharacterized protein LOC132599690 n=1 Tax=Lycium barbarum TaxID=112863 RepID=UPI00293E407E|nr:uncharacterized protein LOC132599690 [Lycium barbarum]
MAFRINCARVHLPAMVESALKVLMIAWDDLVFASANNTNSSANRRWDRTIEGSASNICNHNFVAGESSEDPRLHEMVMDALGMYNEGNNQQHVDQPPNEEAQRFYAQLESASRPFCEGMSHSALSVAVRLLSIKSDANISIAGMNAMIELMKELNPNLDIPDDYYKAKKLVSKLGLSSMKIDCCEKGCMLYYRDNADLENCKVCGISRFKQLASGNRVAVKKKCTWNPVEDSVIRSNFTKKVSSRLSNIFSEARKKGQKPGWLGTNYWEELNQYWATPEFQKKSAQTKAARKSEKGGSLHTCGLVSMGTVRRKLQVTLGRPPNRHEVWKKTHTKIEDGKEVWVKPRAEDTYNRYNQAMEELTRSQSTDDQGNTIMPSEEQTISCWLDVVGGVNKGRAYDLCSEKNFHRLQCGLQGIGSSATVSNEQLEEMRHELRELARNYEEERKKRLEEERRRINLESDVKELKNQVCNLIKLPRSPPSSPDHDDGEDVEDEDDQEHGEAEMEY